MQAKDLEEKRGILSGYDSGSCVISTQAIRGTNRRAWQTWEGICMGDAIKHEGNDLAQSGGGDRARAGILFDIVQLHAQAEDLQA